MVYSLKTNKQITWLIINKTNKKGNSRLRSARTEPVHVFFCCLFVCFFPILNSKNPHRTPCFLYLSIQFKSSWKMPFKCLFCQTPVNCCCHFCCGVMLGQFFLTVYFIILFLFLKTFRIRKFNLNTKPTKLCTNMNKNM